MMERIFEIATLFGMSVREAEAAGWTAVALECAPCGMTTHLSLWRIKTMTRFGYLEEITARMRCRFCNAAPSAVFLLRPVVKDDPFKKLTYRVEEWTTGGLDLVDLLAATSNGAIAHVAYEEGLKHRPGRPMALRHGTRLVLSTFGTDPPPSNIVVWEPKPAEAEMPKIERRRRG